MHATVDAHVRLRAHHPHSLQRKSDTGNSRLCNSQHGMLLSHTHMNKSSMAMMVLGVVAVNTIDVICSES